MRVLWIVNINMPKIAAKLHLQTGAAGGWLHDLCDKIGSNDSIELSVASVYSGNEFVSEVVEGVRYYLLPGGSKKMMFYDKGLGRFWRIIEEQFSPDIVHIHGTEYTHSISYIRQFPNKTYLLTIQGIITKISKESYGDLGYSKALLNRTWKENIKLNGMIENKWLLSKNTKYEREIIQTVKYATGRTFWDRAVMKELNPDLEYYRCNYNLRQAFYSSPKWNINQISRYKIITGAALTPLKGLDVLVRAISIVRNKYPDVKLIVPGGVAEHGKLKVQSGYTKYVMNLTQKLGVEECIEFVGKIGAESVVKNLLDAHVCVVPSAMEGASATLCEAMYLGVPSIAAYRGGMTELLRDKESGFYYDFPEYSVLAQRIMEIFENDLLAEQFSKQVQDDASARHNREKNVRDMIEVYKKILEIERVADKVCLN